MNKICFDLIMSFLKSPLVNYKFWIKLGHFLTNLTLDI